MTRTMVALRAVSVVAVAALALSACGGSSSGSGDSGSGTYKIGLVNSSGGAFAAGNKSGDDGARYAIKLINAKGGIDGHKISIVAGDLQGEPKNGTTLIPQIVGKGVFAIAGPVASGEVEISYAVANKLKVPSISPGAGRPGVLDNARPYGYSLAQADKDVTTPVLAALIKSKGYKTAALIGDGVNAATALQVPLFEDLFKQAGVKLVKNVSFTTGDSSFASQVTAIAATKPDVIAMAAGPADAGRIAREVRSQGLDAVLMGTSGLQSGGAAYAAAGGDSAEGTISAAQFDASNPEEPAKSLLAEARTATGQKEIALNFAYGFDTINILAKVIEDQGVKPGDSPAKARAAIQAGLKKLGDFKGMSGTTSFTSNGTGERPHLLAIMQKGVFVIQRDAS